MKKNAAARTASLETALAQQKRMKALVDYVSVDEETANKAVEQALLGEALTGNFAAQKFWLTCRLPDKWDDNREPEPDAEDDGLFEAIRKAVEENTK